MTMTPPASLLDSTSASPMIAPMHDPARSAVVQPPKPLGNCHPNVVPGQNVDPSLPSASLGAKALFAKKFAQQNKPTFSPTDAIQSPCTAKLNSAKQRRFAKGKAPTATGARLTALTANDENSPVEA